MSLNPPSITIDIFAYPDDVSHLFLLTEGLSKPVWLDSGFQNSQKKSIRGRYDIISADPTRVLCNPNYQDIERAVSELINPEPSELDNALSICEDTHQSKFSHLPFLGGAIGYFNYEHNVHEYELDKHESFKAKPLEMCDSYVGIFDWAMIVDHKFKKSYLICLANCSVERKTKYRKILKESVTKKNDDCASNGSLNRAYFEASNVTSDISKNEYRSALEKIQNYIVEGDVYQINFAQRFSANFSGSKIDCYVSLRQVLPSPYSAYIDLSDEKILCFSPERFIDIKNGIATTKPIKGTAPRGKTAKEDEVLAKELRLSEKNLAENLMIVDLLRNDFSRLCKPHTVKTPKLFALESFINVHHLVSTVTGELDDNVTPLQLLDSCFPGGSITGAPKKRAMEIIQELEQHPRNIYCGTIFYLDVRGKLDSNITIRSLLAKDDKIYCWGGGGIVFDSDIDDEYQETFHKVNVLLEALKSSKK